MFAKRLLSSLPRLSTASVLARSISTRALLAPKAPITSPIVRAVNPVRSLHTTRAMLAEGKSLGSIHVLEAPTVTTWQEIPKGGLLYKGMNRKQIIWKIWYNHAVTPLYAVIGLATALMFFFLWKYFTRHTEIAWSKSLRGTYDHTGLDDSRADSHSRRLLYPGMRDRNKRDVRMFPFNFVPMHKIAEKRFVDYNKEE